jgi:deoxyribonuclease-4
MSYSFAHPIGSHVPRKQPLVGAATRNAQIIQINLSAPRNWATPQIQGDETELAKSPLPIFVHAPYLINPASINPEIRSLSRTCLEAESKAASIIEAKGLVVHGGYPTGEGSIKDAIRGWHEVLKDTNLPCRILIENTAGGNNSPARSASNTALLINSLRSEGHNIGFVFDTCHAWASGEDPLEMISQIHDSIGPIDLTHANNSRDPQGSARDRHANLTNGTIPFELLMETIIAADAPVVVETPGGSTIQAADICLIKSALNCEN